MNEQDYMTPVEETLATEEETLATEEETTPKEELAFEEEIEAGWYTKEEVRELLKTAKFAARTQAYCYAWSRE